MAHLEKPKYRPINTSIFKIISRLLVTLLIFVYFQYLLRTFDISRMIYTDMT